MTYKLPEQTLLSVYKHRRAGYGPYDVAKNVEDEGLGRFSPATLIRHADSKENVKKYTESGEYHPKVEKSNRNSLTGNELDKAFSLRKQGISDNKIADILGLHPETVRNTLNNNQDHPNYTPNQNVNKPNPEDLVSSILRMHGTVNDRTGQPHTYGTIAAEHGITRSKVAGIISRNKGSKKMESINTKIKNILKESWMEKRKETIERVRKRLEDEGPERRDQHFSSLHSILIDAHNELSKLESQRDIHPDVAKMSKRIRQQLVGHVENIMTGENK